MRQIWSIALWEFKQRRNFTLWWIFGTVIIVAVILLVYPSIRDQADQFQKLIQQLPESLRGLKTGGSGADVTSPIGFLNSQVYYATLPLFMIIMGINYGSSVLASDEQNHTLELLLVRPVSRAKVLIAKALSGAMILAVLTIIVTAVTLVFAKIVKLDVSILDLIYVNVLCSLFSWSFGAIAFALTATTNLTRRASTGLAIFVSLGGYLLNSLASLTDFLVKPAKLFPYHYYNPTNIMHGRVDRGLMIYLAIVLVFCTGLSLLSFRHRDIN